MKFITDKLKHSVGTAHFTFFSTLFETDKLLDMRIPQITNRRRGNPNHKTAARTQLLF